MWLVFIVQLKKRTSKRPSRILHGWKFSTILPLTTYFVEDSIFEIFVK